MKVLLAVISLLVSVAVAEPPAPYPASGWRPSGPSFEIPQRTQFQQPQEYLPPLDPRNPVTPSVEYGTPEDDVSVQGLPAQEEVPFFQNSPINGKQTVGAGFKYDIRNLDQGFKQSQFQQQQQTYRQFDRQRQLEAQNNGNQLSRFQPPGPFPRTTPAPTEATTPTTEASTTELNLNEGETLDAPKNRKVSVEVSRQKVQEIPGELYLSSLAQLQLQPQFVPLQQFGQIRSPVLVQPGQSQKQIAGYDAQTHFAALPSVLTQQQLQQQKIRQNLQAPALLIAEQPQPPVAQYQPINYQPQLQQEQVALQPQQPLPQYQPVNSYQQPQLQPEPMIQPQTVYAQPNTVQSLPQFPVNYQPQQFPAQPVILQPQAVNQLQPGQPKPNNPDAESIDEQYQPQLYQQPFLIPQPVQGQFQPQPNQFQGQFQPQPALIQAQPINYPNPEIYQTQQQPQSPDALQSGLDVNQQGNDLDESDDEEANEQDEGNKATAVATAFGARTQPRLFTKYGAPFPVPRVQANPGFTTTESPVEEITEEDAPIVAQAVAVADGTSRKKSAKLRSRRVRPLFTLDRSGHLVLAQGQ